MDNFLKLYEEYEKSGISDDIFDGLVMKLKETFEEEKNEGALLLLSVIEKVIENSMFKSELISSFKEALDEVLDIEEDKEEEESEESEEEKQENEDEYLINGVEDSSKEEEFNKLKNKENEEG